MQFNTLLKNLHFVCEFTPATHVLPVIRVMVIDGLIGVQAFPQAKKELVILKPGLYGLMAMLLSCIMCHGRSPHGCYPCGQYTGPRSPPESGRRNHTMSFLGASGD